MQPFPKKDPFPDFSRSDVQKAFVEQTADSKSLWQKELDTNRAEQTLLLKRLTLMKDFLNNLPSSDPQYSMLAIQLKMDQIELDELKVQEALLIQKLSDDA